MKNKAIYVIGIILILGLLAYAAIKIIPHENNLKSENLQIYSDDKITFSIPSELEQYKTSFGSDKGIILSKFENDVAVISITVVSSSTSLDYIWTENCGSTTSCGREKYAQDYFDREYNELVKLHPDILDKSTKTIKDEISLQDSYEKTVLINENIIFGTKVVFDGNSNKIVRIVYYYASNLEQEFQTSKNKILNSLEFSSA